MYAISMLLRMSIYILHSAMKTGIKMTNSSQSEAHFTWDFYAGQYIPEYTLVEEAQKMKVDFIDNLIFLFYKERDPATTPQNFQDELKKALVLLRENLFEFAFHYRFKVTQKLSEEILEKCSWKENEGAQHFHLHCTNPLAPQFLHELQAYSNAKQELFSQLYYWDLIASIALESSKSGNIDENWTQFVSKLSSEIEKRTTEMFVHQGEDHFAVLETSIKQSIEYCQKKIDASNGQFQNLRFILEENCQLERPPVLESNLSLQVEMPQEERSAAGPGQDQPSTSSSTSLSALIEKNRKQLRLSGPLHIDDVVNRPLPQNAYELDIEEWNFWQNNVEFVEGDCGEWNEAKDVEMHETAPTTLRRRTAEPENEDVEIEIKKRKIDKPVISAQFSNCDVPQPKTSRKRSKESESRDFVNEIPQKRIKMSEREEPVTLSTDAPQSRISRKRTVETEDVETAIEKKKMRVSPVAIPAAPMSPVATPAVPSALAPEAPEAPAVEKKRARRRTKLEMKEYWSKTLGVSGRLTRSAARKSPASFVMLPYY